MNYDRNSVEHDKKFNQPGEAHNDFTHQIC